MPLDGGAARVVMARATGHMFYRLDADRSVVMVDVEAGVRGTLLMYDGHSDAGRPLDEQGLIGSGGIRGGLGPGKLIYSVDDGERSGVWLARPKAR